MKRLYIAQCSLKIQVRSTKSVYVSEFEVFYRKFYRFKLRKTDTDRYTL